VRNGKIQHGSQFDDGEKIMNARKSAIVALVAFIGLGAPMLQSAAVAQPTASPAAEAKTTGGLSAVEKANLIAKLKAVKQKRREALKLSSHDLTGSSQDPSAKASPDKTLYEINVLITKIGDNEEVPMSDVDKALASPGSAP